jgi:hypothetical protein
MTKPKGLDYDLTGPMEYEESGHVVDLYVNYEGLEALRDNTSREYSQFFDNLLKSVDQALADTDGEKQDEFEQEPLPGL